MEWEATNILSWNNKGLKEHNTSSNFRRNSPFSTHVATVTNTKSTKKMKALKSSASCKSKIITDKESHMCYLDNVPRRFSSEGKEDQFGKMNFSWLDKIERCPVYHPSKEEFDDPFLYLHKIAPEASKFGICKVVSPLISSVPAGVVLMNEKKDFKFTTKVQPLRLAKWDNNDRIRFFLRGRNYTLRDFENMANKVASRKYSVSGCLPSAYLEKEFWNEMIHGKKGTVEYGINVDGSAFSCSSSDPLAQSNWNLKTLPRLPRSILRLIGNAVPGVTDPMLYIGMLFSMFAWHVEDHYLYSINYHHCGAPKTWYGVPGQAALEFEKTVQHHIYNKEILSPEGENGAFNILAEKTTMFPPKILLEHNVPVYKAVQVPGEFVITFPRAYHAGFSHGFNCGEAVNFATIDWFQFGAEATQRYGFLGRMPIIPCEELVCKEAMFLSKSSSYNVGSASSSNSFSLRTLKISFVCLLTLHHRARWFLKKPRKSLRIHPKPQMTIFCNLCKRECYVAHFICKCYPDPICLFHDSQIYNCSCRSICTIIFLREDVPEMEAVAKMFQQEKEISDEVEKQVKQIHQIEDDDYVPFSEMEHNNKKPGSIRKCCTKAERSIEMETFRSASRKKRKVTC